jgi:hypothetical protein
MSLYREQSFWGSLSPLGGLTGAGLLIMASARLSWAITIAGSLFWVYGFTSFSFSLLSSLIGNDFFPVRGRTAVYTCLASFWGGLYLFLLWMLSPFAAMEVFMLLLLVPLYCANSCVFNDASDISENVSGSLSQAAILTCLLILFSIIREPLSYCSLSLPGTHQGMITTMYFTENSFLPIGIFASSAGALLLLGFVISLYQYTKSFIMPGAR